MTPTPSWRENYSRLAKAIKLADVLRAMNVFSWQILECADPDGVWNNAARLAHFAADYSPSQETRDVAIGLMRDREAVETRLKEASGG
jgi:hypothetical protein